MPECTQDALLRKMPPSQRLAIAQSLYETAWEIKAAGLRAQFPKAAEEHVQEAVRRIFQTGYAGAGRDYFATRTG